MSMGKVWITLAESVQKKAIHLLKMLKRVYLQLESTLSIESEVNNKINETDLAAIKVQHVNTLFRHQKCYVKMIDSLAPESELSSEEANLRYDHVSRFYEKFISNQTEITTVIGDGDLDDQINIFKEVQHKVLLLQGTLTKFFSPNKSTHLPESDGELNEHLNPTDRRSDTVDVLDSHYKKQRSLIKQIELIESKNNLGAADAETLRSHLAQLHESFIQNQAKIESCVNGPALDKELKISCEILEKVMSLQTKLNKIIAPITLSSSAQTKPIKSSSEQTNQIIPSSVQSNPVKPSSALSNLILPTSSYQPSAEVQKLRSGWYSEEKREVRSLLESLLNFKKWFISNQKEIAKRVNGYELHQHTKISTDMEIKLKKIQIEYEFYYGVFQYLDLLNDEVSYYYDNDLVVSFTR